MNEIGEIVLSCIFSFMLVSAALVTAACMNSSRISRLKEDWYIQFTKTYSEIITGEQNENRESENNY